MTSEVEAYALLTGWQRFHGHTHCGRCGSYVYGYYWIGRNGKWICNLCLRGELEA